MTELTGEHELILTQLREIESKLIPLKSHIRGIAEYFHSKDCPDYSTVADWFWMSSSINSVDFDGIRYNSAFMMCRPAYEYESQKQELHASLMNELTRFLYVYSGFESLLNNLDLPDCPGNRGKINKAKNQIKTKFSDFFPPTPAYAEVVGMLRILINASSLKDCTEYFAIDECTDHNGIGLKVVYQLRNRLAHGDFNFPEPDDWSLLLPLEPEITRISTRVILISIQMMMLAKNKDNFENLIFLESQVVDFDESEDDYMINELPFLSTFHILKKEKNEFQLKLDLK